MGGTAFPDDNDSELWVYVNEDSAEYPATAAELQEAMERYPEDFRRYLP